MSAKLIALEGLSNAGKTYYCQLISNKLSSSGIETKAVLELRSPSGRVLDQLFRRNDTLPPVLKTLLFAADRYYLYENSIAPYLKKNTHVIVDRYTYTTFVYRMLEGLPKRWLVQVEKYSSTADLNILIDITPEESLKRASLINKPKHYSLEFLTQVQKQYLKYVNNEKMVYVNGMTNPKAVAREIYDIIKDFITFA